MLAVAASLAAGSIPARAQELEPRAYAPNPTGANFVPTAFGMGLTLAVPLKGSSAFKVSWARGVTTSVGGRFDALAVAYQFLWF